MIAGRNRAYGLYDKGFNGLSSSRVLRRIRTIYFVSEESRMSDTRERLAVGLRREFYFCVLVCDFYNCRCDGSIVGCYNPPRRAKSIISIDLIPFKQVTS